jgi:hypothetical protein
MYKYFKVDGLGCDVHFTAVCGSGLEDTDQEQDEVYPV